MVKIDKQTWKANYVQKLNQCLDEYPKVFLVGVDNVRSKQMQQIRASLRGKAELLMGKNTMIRKAIRAKLDENPALEVLLPHIKGNVGFVFTKDDLGSVRDGILANKVKAPARAGAIAPCDVFVPKGPTSMGPEKTSFFQALKITTKISRGNIEILNDIHLITEGDKVGASEASLLNMLGISPFQYGLVINQIYDNGCMYSEKVLDTKDDEILGLFMQGVSKVAATSLSIGYPTVASVPHSIVNGFKNVMAVALATDITFEEATKAKAYLADPSAFVVEAAPVEAAPAEEKKEAAAAPESEDESDDDMGLGLFG